MNLQPVSGKPFQKMCALCFRNFLFGRSMDPAEHPIGGYADLDGKPFEAYYCNKCASTMQEMRVRLATNRASACGLNISGGTDVHALET